MNIFNSLLISVFLIIFSACNTKSNVENKPNSENTTSQLKIGISKAKGSKGYLKYGLWLHKLDSNIAYIDLYHISLDSALRILNNCDGLLVSGGPDVDPARYHQIQDTILCETIDYRRDSLEYALIELALKHKMPILGICRGEQILNVYMGGSLYPDIPTAKPNNVGHRFSHIDSSMHSIKISPSSLLFDIAQAKEGIVNSSHHQAVDRLADNLVILARTSDGIVESISWKNKSGKGFLLGIQWHPEWLDINNPFSRNIGDRFIKEARKYHLNNKK